MKQSTRIMPAVIADCAPLVAVLAAGGATRFGGGKLDAPCAGKPVGQWAIDAARHAGFASGVIVVGAQPPQLAETCGWTILLNTRAEQGLGTSLAMAASYALELGRPLLALLADMPLVTGGHLQSLAQSGDLAATAYPSGKLGVPAYFPVADLPQLAALSGDIGAGPLLSARDDVRRIDAPENAVLDIDTPEDLARAEVLLNQRG